MVLPLGALVLGAAAHLQHPGQVFAAHKGSIHMRFCVGRRVGIGAVVPLQLFKPRFQLSLMLVRLHHRGLMFIPNLLRACNLAFRAGQAFLPCGAFPPQKDLYLGRKCRLFFQIFTQGYQRAMFPVAGWPVRRCRSYRLILRAGGYSPVT